MKAEEHQLGTMLHALQERAKELNCLYQVGELLNHSERSLDDIFRSIIQVLPPGWQYPADCQARIIFEGTAIQAPEFLPTPWVQRASIVVQQEAVGAIEVSYRRELPRSDEGPFLKEERRLIDTIADRIAEFLVEIVGKMRWSESDPQLVTINGEPGLLLRHPTFGDGTFSFDIADGRIRAIYVVRNPDKLRGFLEHTH